MPVPIGPEVCRTCKRPLQRSEIDFLVLDIDFLECDPLGEHSGPYADNGSTHLVGLVTREDTA